MVAAIIVILLLGGGAWYLLRDQPPSVAATTAGAADRGETIGAGELHTAGNPNAKVVVIEYAAPSCPTCAFVNNTTIPEFKRRYIDTGKVLYVFRIFPIDPADFKAGGLAMCVRWQNGARRCQLLTLT